ncbi:MAG: hypothetical protein JWO38_2750 [Gemmataceae bacterium]|nr:hypothetical protein [Gemmataceae bacterium]
MTRGGLGVRKEASRVGLILGLAVIYVVWGSTYLAIHYAIETVPPFLMAGARFLLAGALLTGWAWARRDGRPTGRQWRNAAVAGLLMLLVGNGGVTWAQQTVPSGVASLVAATMPGWLVVFEWGRAGRRPRPAVAAGIVVGLTGVAVLGLPGLVGLSDGVSLSGTAALLVAAASWAAGSLFARHADLPRSPTLTTGMEMLAGGVALTATGVLTGEPDRFDPVDVSAASAAAFLYLLAAAVLALSVYTWLLTVADPGLVGTYAFVNPVVAVLLGWAVAGEQLTPPVGLAAALVVAGVALITWPRKPSRGNPP